MLDGGRGGKEGSGGCWWRDKEMKWRADKFLMKRTPKRYMSRLPVVAASCSVAGFELKRLFSLKHTYAEA
jgi:hypothetical protein